MDTNTSSTTSVDIDLQYTIENVLKTKNFDLVRLVEAFGKLLENNLNNVDYLLRVAARIKKKKEVNVASQLLLTIYDRFKDNFKEASLSRHCLKLLKLANQLNPLRKDLRADLVTAYRDTFTDRENLERYIEKSEIEEEGSLAEAMKVLDTHIDFDEGCYLFQDNFGIGQVVGVDLEEGRFKLDFPGKKDPKTKAVIYPAKKGHEVSVRMIPQFATPLSNEGFMLRCHLEIDKLKEMAKEDCVGLMCIVLKDYDNRMTLKQLKGKLAPTIIATTKWATWWKEVKSIIGEDPYYEVGEGPSAIIERLEVAKSPDEVYIAKFKAGASFSDMLEEARQIILNTSNSGHYFKDEVFRICEAKQKEELPLPEQVELMLFLKENCEYFGIEVEVDLGDFLTDAEQSKLIIKGVIIPDYQQTLLQYYKATFKDSFVQGFRRCGFLYES